MNIYKTKPVQDTHHLPFFFNLKQCHLMGVYNCIVKHWKLLNTHPLNSVLSKSPKQQHRQTFIVYRQLTQRQWYCL